MVSYVSTSIRVSRIEVGFGISSDKGMASDRYFIWRATNASSVRSAARLFTKTYDDRANMDTCQTAWDNYIHMIHLTQSFCFESYICVSFAHDQYCYLVHTNLERKQLPSATALSPSHSENSVQQCATCSISAIMADNFARDSGMSSSAFIWSSCEQNTNFYKQHNWKADYLMRDKT